jgi:hypothetical protein
MRVLFSLVVDDSPVFAYKGYHLVQSILRHCGGENTVICVNVTAKVSQEIRAIFEELGCTVSELASFGDGSYCNKIAQLPNIQREEFDLAVLLDTDTILIEDIRLYLHTDCLQAKLVDMPNPSMAILAEIGRLAGLEKLPDVTHTDSGVGETFLGNCNGGFYAIPRNLFDKLSVEWPRWAAWLFKHIEPLRREGKENHVDQVSMWLVLHLNGLTYESAPSNFNYYIHFQGDHLFYIPQIPISLLHYHNEINVLGLIESPYAGKAVEREAIQKANDQISQNFNSVLFWNFRYHQWPERGSGVGSRGEALLEKRKLLKAEGIEQAESVLDVGCGDLEVLRELKLSNYVGLDRSKEALQRAAKARDDWSFRLMVYSDPAIAPAEFVLCMEVLIHQATAGDYHQLIDFLGQKTRKKLIVSGYESEAGLGGNHMLFYYEPLKTSLERTERFRKVEKIGTHTSVAVYRCTVK